MLHPDILWYATGVNGAPGFDNDLTLLYQFDKYKTLSAIEELGPTLAITRATEKRVYGSTGLIETVASGVAGFDHNPVTLVSLGLLVEEARTNICLQSEDLSTTWDNTDSTESTNTQTAPDGLSTADTVTNTHASNTGYMFQNFISTTVAYTYSHYLKAGTSSATQLGIVDQGTLEVTATFNLSAGTAAEGVGSPDSFGIEDVGNGWFRCHVTHTFSTAGASDTIRLGNDGANASTVHAWGAQVEVGAFPTSYIKTEGSSVTRNKDEVNTTDVSWFTNTAGTFYVAASLPVDGNDQACAFTLEADISNNITMRYRTATTLIEIAHNTGTGDDGLVSPAGAYTAGSPHRTAMAFAANDGAAVTDGGSVSTDSTLGVPTTNALDTLRIGFDLLGANHWNGHIAEIRYYNVRKPNQFLEDLSNGLLTI